MFALLKNASTGQVLEAVSKDVIDDGLADGSIELSWDGIYIQKDMVADDDGDTYATKDMQPKRRGRPKKSDDSSEE